MPTKIRDEGETATLRKRKRDRKDEERSARKKHRSKSNIPNGHSDAGEKKRSQPESDNAKVSNDTEIVLHGSALGIAAYSKRTVPAQWKVSQPMGGRMLDIDPIFSPDEKHLIVTYNTSIQIYGTADSLLVRRISIPLARMEESPEWSGPQIVATRLSRSATNYIWVACSDGRIWHIDWTSGVGAESPYTLIARQIVDVAVDSVHIGNAQEDILFVLEKTKKSSGQVVAYNASALSTNSGKLVHTFGDGIHLIQSALEGSVVVAAGKDSVHIGYARIEKKGIKSLADLEYRFCAFDIKDKITCLDIRAFVQHPNSQNAPAVDLAVGCARGSIFVFSDIVAKLHNIGGKASRKGPIQPLKLHWHRKAVHSVKWSEDGNYLVSGGSETVLVLWQLDTGKKDFLPHLSAALENIVVSPQGSSYAVHLDDNTTMVLSTAEMIPTMYVSGIQSLAFTETPSKDTVVRRVWKDVEEISSPLAATSHPVDPSQMLLCVGNGQQTNTEDGPSAPLVQVFDLTSFQTISKHALARTNPSENNMTSQGFPIIDPKVTSIAFSHDGKWLASVDEWQPPERDMEPLAESAKNIKDACEQRREVYLKFWEVGADNTSLQLVSRVNNAHHSDKASSIFDVACDPTSTRFATIGDDETVRFWTPKSRKRDGLVDSGSDGKALKSWGCSLAIPLTDLNQHSEDVVDTLSMSARSGALSYSEDGSILFAAIGGQSEAVVYVIDALSGEICDRIQGLIRGQVKSIKAVASCLVLLSEDITVYDVVLDELRFGFSLKQASNAAVQLTQLAVNQHSRSFAVAIPVVSPGQEEIRRGTTSELVVFSIEDSQPQLVQAFPQLITSILPATGSSGFIVVDSAAQTWSVAEGPEATQLVQPLADFNLDIETAEKVSDALLDGDHNDESDEEMQDDNRDEEMEDYDAHPAVVAPQQLASIFNAAPSFAMPPIEDVFYQVAGLFSARSAPGSI